MRVLRHQACICSAPWNWYMFRQRCAVASRETHWRKLRSVARRLTHRHLSMERSLRIEGWWSSRGSEPGPESDLRIDDSGRSCRGSRPVPSHSCGSPVLVQLSPVCVGTAAMDPHSDLVDRSSRDVASWLTPGSTRSLPRVIAPAPGNPGLLGRHMRDWGTRKKQMSRSVA